MRTLYKLLLILLLHAGSWCVSAELASYDLSHIYNKQYQYVVPRDLVDLWFQGGGFPEVVSYSDNEKQLIRDLVKRLTAQIDAIPANKQSVITAGAPGAGKTILFEQIMEHDRRPFVYIDPNEQLKLIYKTLVVSGRLDPEILLEQKGKEQQYIKWRPASNYIAHWGLAYAVKEGKPFYFGSTSSGEKTPFYFQFLKDKDYQIEVIHVSSPESVCLASIDVRNKLFYQALPRDVENKAKDIVERLSDTFLKKADVIKFYWRDAIGLDARHVASWSKKEGIFNVVDLAGWEKVKSEYGGKWPKDIKEQKLIAEK